jgi:hypothetical protein
MLLLGDLTKVLNLICDNFTFEIHFCNIYNDFVYCRQCQIPGPSSRSRTSTKCKIHKPKLMIAIDKRTKTYCTNANIDRRSNYAHQMAGILHHRSYINMIILVQGFAMHRAINSNATTDETFQ